MHPILIRWGPFTISTYGALLVAAFLTVMSLATAAARRMPARAVAIPSEQMGDFLCVVLLGGLLGGRLFFIALNWRDF